MQTDIDHDETGIGIADVRGNEGPEPFLASGVPELEAESFALDLHGFGDEVDADSGLYGGMVTLEVN